MRRYLALAGALAFMVAGFSGCAAKTKEGPSQEEISHMVNRLNGAITGTILDRYSKPMYNQKIWLFGKAGGDAYRNIETLHDGKFYFDRIPGGSPSGTEYIVSARLKDWPECTVTVYNGKFTNVTIQEPYFENTVRKGGCIRQP